MIPVFFSFQKIGIFLLAIDAFSWKLFCRPLRSKKALVVQKALESIFNEFGSPITKIESDSGTEFIGNRKFFESQHIFFSTKHSKHKISLIQSKLSL